MRRLLVLLYPMVIHQGGILSPTLFSIYMDDLSFILSESGIGCQIVDLCINMYFMPMIFA